MSNKRIDENARQALKQMKMEIAKEIGMDNVKIPTDSGGVTSREYGFYGGPVGGEMTRRLVTMGEKKLLEKNQKEQ